MQSSRIRVLSGLLRYHSRITPSTSSFLALRFASNTHSQESFEAFSERYVKFFKGVQDVFELQRGLNNCFAHDLVPSVPVIEEALRAARRVDDYSTAVRIFEGIKEKVENDGQYKAYLDELQPLRNELGIETREELYSS